VRSIRNWNELQGSKFGGEQALACSSYFRMAEAALRELLQLGYHDSGLALCKPASPISARCISNFTELQGSKFGGERAFACSPDFSMLEAVLRELLRLGYHVSGLALCRPVLFISVRSIRSFTEPQSSKFGEEQALACSPYFSMVKVASRELLRHQYHDSGLDLCRPVSYISERSFRNFTELQGSKFGGERALACSPYFCMVEVVLRELFRLGHHDSGLALCRPVSFISVRSIRNLTELQSSKFGRYKHLLVRQISAWWRRLFQSCSAFHTTIQALRSAGLFHLFQCGPFAITELQGSEAYLRNAFQRAQARPRGQPAITNFFTRLQE
jgi:hypothetical protein